MSDKQSSNLQHIKVVGQCSNHSIDYTTEFPKITDNHIFPNVCTS